MESRERAKSLRQMKKYEDAEIIYRDIYNNSDLKKVDKWIGWEYADTLKKLNKIDEAIKISKHIYLYNKEFKYIKDLLAWCLYEKYFKDIKQEQIKDIDNLINIGSFITNITIQDEKLPYEKITFKIIKLVQKSEKYNKFEIVNEWLDKLNYKELSKSSYTLNNNEIKKIEIASPFEEWFYYKIKCQYELGNYIQCKENCEYILNEVNRFHNNRDKWIKRIKANCLWNLGEKDNSIKVLQDLNKEFKNIIIMYELAQKYIEIGEMKKGMDIASRAILFNEPIDKKVGIITMLGEIFYKSNEKEDAFVYYSICKDHIYNNSFKINIENRIKELSKDCNIKSQDIMKMFKKVTLSNICFSSERKQGRVLSLLSNNKAGFIKHDSKSYYFKINSLIDKRTYIKIDDKVTFSIVDSFDKRKGNKSEEAIDIIIE